MWPCVSKAAARIHAIRADIADVAANAVAETGAMAGGRLTRVLAQIAVAAPCDYANREQQDAADQDEPSGARSCGCGEKIAEEFPPAVESAVGVPLGDPQLQKKERQPHPGPHANASVFKGLIQIDMLLDRRQTAEQVSNGSGGGLPTNTGHGPVPHIAG